jgi:anti-repressor protein
MKELKLIESVEGFIPIYETDTGEKVVKGIELHEGLSVQKAFSTWIKNQLGDIDAIENKDFFPLKEESKGGRPLIDYILKLETAKEICLVAGASPRANETLKQKSKDYRKYLIQFEERYKNQFTDKQLLQLKILNGDEVERVLALREYEQVVTKPLKEKIKENKPKVDAYERFLNSDWTYTATALKGIFGFPSAVAMNKKLHELKLIYKPGNSKKWTAYKDTPKSWYRVIATEYGDTLRWTPKGILGIAKLLNIELSKDTIKDLIDNENKQ